MIRIDAQREHIDRVLLFALALKTEEDDSMVV